jgi:hypothetical protein
MSVASVVDVAVVADVVVDEVESVAVEAFEAVLVAASVVVAVVPDAAAVEVEAVESPSTDCRSLNTVCMAVTRACSAEVRLVDEDDDEDDDESVLSSLSWVLSAGGGGGGGGGPIIAVVASVEDSVVDEDAVADADASVDEDVSVDDPSSEEAWVKAARISLLNRLSVPVSELLVSDEVELLDAVEADVVVVDAASSDVDETD